MKTRRLNSVAIGIEVPAEDLPNGTCIRHRIHGLFGHEALGDEQRFAPDNSDRDKDDVG